MKLIFTDKARKQIQSLSVHIQKLIRKKTQALLDINQKNNNIKKLVGMPDLYRLRVGDYRIIYQIKKQELIILVLKVGHRKDIYN